MKSFSTRYITALRFPLALGVVMIHAYALPWREEAPVAWEGFHNMAMLLSRVLPSVVVPLFFAISGYLFFYKVETFTPAVYLDKLRRRFFTLLVPYLAWNTLAVVLYWGRDSFSDLSTGADFVSLWSYIGQHGGLGIFWGSQVQGHADFVNWAGLYVHDTLAPVLMPLWFVRDLMCCVLLSPLVCWCGRRMGWTLWGALGLIYVSGLWPNWGGVSVRGLFYFSLGAWLSLRQINPVECASRGILPASLVALVLTFLLWLREDVFGMGYSLACVLYVLSSMVCAVWAASAWTERHEPVSWLARGSFFLYASHAIVLQPLSAFVAHWCISRGEAFSVVGYFLIPALTVVCCMAAYRFLSHFSCTWVLTGNHS